MTKRTPDLTVAQVATEVGVTEQTIRREIQRGKLPAYRVGEAGHLRIRAKDLDSYKQAEDYRSEPLTSNPLRDAG
jgi:excisionase family DNA binding protein